MSEDEEVDFSVGDMITFLGFGRAERIYFISAILLGAEGWESLVEMECLDRGDGSGVDGSKTNAIVPYEMLWEGVTCGIFNHVPASELDGPKASL